MIDNLMVFFLFFSGLVHVRPVPELARAVFHARQHDCDLRGIRAPRGPGQRRILQRRPLLGVHDRPVRRRHRSEFWRRQT